jgi:hypothetical protein
MPPVAAPYTIPKEVARYCTANHLTPHLETALRLAEECFAPVQRIEVVLEPDPEVDAEYVVIDVWTNGSVDEAVSRKEQYTRRWVASIPSWVIGRIRLLSHPR